MPVERCTHVLEYFRFIYLFKKHVYNGLLQTKELPTKLKVNMNELHSDLIHKYNLT